MRSERQERGSVGVRPLRLPRTMDLDLRGRLGIRLIDALPADVAGVERELGSLPAGSLASDPDLRVRFVDRLPTRGLRYVETNRTAFTEDGFFVMSSRSRRGIARIPFDTPHGAPEIVCERGGGLVPLLLELVRLIALRKGLVPLHASAFDYRGTGVLVIGWPHGGKTSALLAFAEHGADLVGDEMVFLADAGRRMFGLAAPLEVADWQLRQIPRLAARAGAAHSFAAGAVRAIDRLQRRLPEGPAERLVRAAIAPLDRRLRVRLPAHVVFPGRKPGMAVPEKLFLMLTHDANDIQVEIADPEETVERVIHLMRAEALPLLRHYLAYRFAFPGRTSDLVEQALERQADFLRTALAGKEMHLVRHPRPVSLRELHAALSPFCEQPSGGSAAVPDAYAEPVPGGVGR